MGRLRKNQSMSIATRKLGRDGWALEVPAIGLGCMTMTRFYDAGDEAAALATVDRALELGCFFLDTADFYAGGENEKLVGRAVRGRRDSFVVATKFGLKPDPDDPAGRLIDGRPEYVREAVEDSLLRLGIDHIDLLYQHRVDPGTPIEETVGAMAGLVDEGKVRFLGLSEARPENIRKAHAVHPITALQNELSVWERGALEPGAALETCRELGIGFVAFSPLGRGFLTGRYSSPDDFDPADYRTRDPRMARETFDRNLALVGELREIASSLDATPAQVAIAWVLAQGDDIVPIPGTKSADRLRENLAAAELRLSGEALARLDALAPAVGDRYADMSFVAG